MAVSTLLLFGLSIKITHVCIPSQSFAKVCIKLCNSGLMQNFPKNLHFLPPDVGGDWLLFGLSIKITHVYFPSQSFAKVCIKLYNSGLMQNVPKNLHFLPPDVGGDWFMLGFERGASAKILRTH